MITRAVVKPMFCVRAEQKKSTVPKRKLRPDDVKRSIQQAQLICYNFEDTAACRSAWDRVEEISAAFAHQQERDLYMKNVEEMCKEDPAACKEYDV